MKTDLPPENDVAATLLLIERRAVLRQRFGDDALQVGVEYLAAAANRDDITLQAVDSAAPYDRAFRLDANTKQQAKEIRARLRNPEAYHTLRGLESLYTLLHNAIRDLQREVGVPDSVALAAFGQRPEDQGKKESKPTIDNFDAA